MHPIITDTKGLESFCQSLHGEAFVTLDTEFIRERTYYPKLCLVQLAGSGSEAVIDPLAPGMDLAPLLALLADDKLLKVMHACRQDMEIFYQLMGKLPAPIFDTQVAAMVCGHGESVGYETLVGSLLGRGVDKSSRFTHWDERPLSERQIDYALADVTHLRDLYPKLLGRIEQDGRMHWIKEEMEVLTDPAIYAQEPEDIWMRIKCSQKSPSFLVYLREAAAWREREAQRLNRPRQWIFKDETLVEIARGAPKTREELTRIRGVGNQLKDSQMEQLLAVIARAKTIPQSDWPRLPRVKPPLPGADVVADLLRLLLKRQCELHHVAAKLVAGRDDLLAIAAGTATPELTPALHGWRYEIFGQFAQQVAAGKLGFAIDPATRDITVIDL